MKRLTDRGDQAIVWLSTLFHWLVDNHHAIKQIVSHHIEIRKERNKTVVNRMTILVESRYFTTALLEEQAFVSHLPLTTRVAMGMHRSRCILCHQLDPMEKLGLFKIKKDDDIRSSRSQFGKKVSGPSRRLVMWSTLSSTVDHVNPIVGR